jgi:hypothetical protein
MMRPHKVWTDESCGIAARFTCRILGRSLAYAGKSEFVGSEWRCSMTRLS